MEDFNGSCLCFVDIRVPDAADSNNGITISKESDLITHYIATVAVLVAKSALLSSHLMPMKTLLFEILALVIAPVTRGVR